MVSPGSSEIVADANKLQQSASNYFAFAAWALDTLVGGQKKHCGRLLARAFTVCISRLCLLASSHGGERESSTAADAATVCSAPAHRVRQGHEGIETEMSW